LVFSPGGAPASALIIAGEYIAFGKAYVYYKCKVAMYICHVEKNTATSIHGAILTYSAPIPEQEGQLMKFTAFAIGLIIFALLCSGCAAQPALPDTPDTNSGNTSSTGERRPAPTEAELPALVQKATGTADLIVKAVMLEKRSGLFLSSPSVERVFQITEVLRGCDEVTVNAGDLITVDNAVEARGELTAIRMFYKVGKEYVLTLSLSPNVYWGDQWQFAGMHILMAENGRGIEKIWLKLNDDVDRKKQLNIYTLNALKKYIKKCTQMHRNTDTELKRNYVRSDKLEDIVAGSTGIYKICIWEGLPNAGVLKRYNCYVLEVCKGPKIDRLELFVLPDMLDADEEYLIIIMLDDGVTKTGTLAARTNSYFPLTDTEKVAEVLQLVEQLK